MMLPRSRSAIPRYRSRRLQQGASAVLVAISLMALAASTVLVADVGQLYMAQRQLEQKATLAALAGAKAAGGCVSQTATTVPTVNSAVTGTLSNNSSSSDLVGGLTPVIDIGSIDSTSGISVFTAAATTPAAVRVTLTHSQPASFAPLLVKSSTQGLTASSTAMQILFGDFLLTPTIATETVPPIAVPGYGTIGPIGPINVNVPVKASITSPPILGPLTSGIADLGVFLTLTSDSVEAYGSPNTEEAIARSAEITLSFRFSLQLALPPLATVKVPVGVDVLVPSSTSTLIGLTCNTASLTSSTGVAVVRVGTFSGPAGASTPAPLLGGTQTVASAASLLGAVTLTQTNLSEVTVGDQTPVTLAPISNFAYSHDLKNDCGGRVKNDGSQFPLACRIATAATTNNPQTIGSTLLLTSTVASAIGGYNLVPTVGGTAIPVTTVTAMINKLLTGTTIPSVITGVPSGSVTGIVDSVLSSVLSTLGLGLGTATTAMGYVVEGAPRTFTTAAPPAEGTPGPTT